MKKSSIWLAVLTEQKTREYNALSQKMKHYVGYERNIRKRYIRRNPDAEIPASHFQNTRYLRTRQFEIYPQYEWKISCFWEPVRYLFRSVNRFQTWPWDWIRGGWGWASYNGQSRGGSAREGYIFRLQVYERVAISLIKVHESLGKPVIFVC